MHVDAWFAQWRSLLTSTDDELVAMRQTNPALIARNHRVEEALRAASEDGDLAPTLRLVAALRNPYELAADDSELQQPPSPAERVTETFCGT